MANKRIVTVKRMFAAVVGDKKERVVIGPHNTDRVVDLSEAQLQAYQKSGSLQVVDGNVDENAKPPVGVAFLPPSQVASHAAAPRAVKPTTE